MRGPRESDGPRAGYVYAARWAALGALYDSLVAMTLPESQFREALTEAAQVSGGQRVLELGCGTGSQTVLLARAGASVTAVDGDAMALSRARRKLSAAGLHADVRLGVVEDLPYLDGAFDAVLSSLLFHHLDSASKRTALAQARRVLRVGGRFVLLDFDRPQTVWGWVVSPVMRAFDGFSNTEDNWCGRLPGLLAEAGFDAVAARWTRDTLLGTLTIWEARNG